jgi:hypothetical protein
VWEWGERNGEGWVKGGKKESWRKRERAYWNFIIVS